MRNHAHNYEIRILIGNRAIPEYVSPKNQLTYVEGRKGSDYSIQLINNSYEAVLFVPSVDGLSIMDGKPASEDSGGYVVKGYQSTIVPGWRLDNGSVAKFTFNDVKASYTVASGNGQRNVGVIGCMVFKAKPYLNDYFIPKAMATPAYPSDSGLMRSLLMNYTDTTTTTYGSLNNTMVGCAAINNVSFQPQAAPAVGTEFGQQTTFDTAETTFDKQDVPATTLSLYYDNRKNLEKVGIVFTNPYVTELPNPFPAARAGCMPPTNWRG